MARFNQLYKIACGAKTKPPKIDQKHYGALFADLMLPRQRQWWRRGRRGTGGKPVPRREEVGAEALINDYAKRGKALRMPNATRIIEDGVRFNDNVRGITSDERKTVEQARDLVDTICRLKEAFSGLTTEQLSVIREAVKVIKRPTTRARRDQHFLTQAGTAERYVRPKVR